MDDPFAQQNQESVVTLAPRDIDFALNTHKIDRHNEKFKSPKYLVEVDSTIKALLLSQDTDEDGKITLFDQGTKIFRLATNDSRGALYTDIRGTYRLANLLEELTLAKMQGLLSVTIEGSKINENPVSRLNRFIKHTFWDNLTRCLNDTTISLAAPDPKDWNTNAQPRIYVPRTAPEQHAYYSKLIKEHPSMDLEVHWLPHAPFTAKTIQSLKTKPGLLALEMESSPNDGKENDLKGVPFVVPGGRFNELYGWDSYFFSLGLLASGRKDLAKAIVRNFVFEIRHYGKILNANRTYYLCRSQPPFLTDLALRTFEQIKTEPGSTDFLKHAILAAMKEYQDVWTAEPRLDATTGLSRYRPEGHGVPMETEPGHFKHVLEPYLKKYGLSYDQFIAAYDNEEIHEPELDEYFLHDRAVRESGHDTSTRLENVAADLATIDLNCLLYKYEMDIATTISEVFGDKLFVPAGFCARGQTEHYQSSAEWKERAATRRSRMDQFLWNEEEGIYFDYNTKSQQQGDCVSATSLWALWCGVASKQQAAKLVERGLPLLEFHGGLACTSKLSSLKDGRSSQRQWDYPNGWAPHQVMAWDGLRRYGYVHEAERLIYRWLLMITRAFMDYNGAVVEKYNVTVLEGSQKVDAEYGNQGCDFEGVPLEGFGWTNASYVYGLSLIDTYMRNALGICVPYDNLFLSSSP
ncbi:neutral trehalase [Amylocarpus encephaloides]|uniref:Trehalase n=1 Tax=Amylocarpus encephaloides TaxID=45428 RepID=A0A9P8C720_9HELO|nr:neutral trehalase [Amylocarpus encephaloides]